MFRVAVTEALRTGGYVCVLAPTRDLVRQDCLYFRDRLLDTRLGVGEVHGGISPGERRDITALASGGVRFVVGSAMMLSSDALLGRSRSQRVDARRRRQCVR